MKKQLWVWSLVIYGSWMGAIYANPAVATTDTKVSFCNKHENKIFISIAYKPTEGTSVMARGWWGIEPDKCTTLTLPMTEDKLYLHAQSSSQIYQWLGQKKFCVNSVDAYDLENAADIACNQPGQEQRPFKEVSITQLRAANAEGVATYNFTNTDSTRVGGGIKLCNDTADELYISYAQSKASETNPTLNGWFMAKPGKCFEANRNKEAQELLFFAQSAYGDKKFRGDIPLCTDDYDGYSFKEPATMSCMANNQRIQLFRKMSLPQTAEFEHHFTPEDVYQVRSLVNICNTRSETNVMTVAWADTEIPGQFFTKGWYQIEQGKCLNNLAVDAKEIYIRVENPDRSIVLDGTFEACINDMNAFTYSHSTDMACTGENETKSKFGIKPIAAGTVTLNIP